MITINIQGNFEGNEMAVADTLNNYVSYFDLREMLDFKRVVFNKQFQLSIKKNTSITSKWPVVKLGDVAAISKGKTITEKDAISGNIKVVAGGKDYAYLHNASNRTAFVITVSASGANAGFINFWKEEIFASDCTTVQGKSKDETQFFYQILKFFENEIYAMARGVAQPHVYPDDIKSFKIPLPPLEIQNQIVAECSAVDAAVEMAEQEIERAKGEIEEIFHNLNAEAKKLNEILIKENEIIDPTKESGNAFYIGLENIESNTGRLVGNPITDYSSIKSNKYVYKKGDILYGKLRPNLNKVYLAEQDGICSTDILVLRCKDASLTKFYSYYMRSKEFNDEVLKTVSGQQLPRTKWSLIETIKVPHTKEMKSVVKQIDILEKTIHDAHLLIDNSSEMKKFIIKKYL